MTLRCLSMTGALASACLWGLPNQELAAKAIPQIEPGHPAFLSSDQASY